MKWGNPYLVNEVTVYYGKQRKLRAPNSSDRPIHRDSIITYNNRHFDVVFVIKYIGIGLRAIVYT